MRSTMQLIASFYREKYTLSLVVIFIAKIMIFIKIYLAVLSLNIYTHIVHAPKWFYLGQKRWQCPHCQL